MSVHESDAKPVKPSKGGYKLQRAIAISKGLQKKQAKPKPRRGGKPFDGERNRIRKVFLIRQKAVDKQLMTDQNYRKHIGTAGLSRFEDKPLLKDPYE